MSEYSGTYRSHKIEVDPRKLIWRYAGAYTGVATSLMGMAYHFECSCTDHGRFLALLLGRPVYFRNCDAMVGQSEPLP